MQTQFLMVLNLYERKVLKAMWCRVLNLIEILNFFLDFCLRMNFDVFGLVNDVIWIPCNIPQGGLRLALFPIVTLIVWMLVWSVSLWSVNKMICFFIDHIIYGKFNHMLMYTESSASFWSMICDSVNNFSSSTNQHEASLQIDNI